MNQNKDLFGLFRTLIYNETLYLRHWIGEVVDDQDESKRGRVKVTIPELGFMTPAEGIWASPRQGYSMMPPAPGEWVEVYFIGGDLRRPVYLAGLGEVTGNTPEVYTDPKTRVLWQDAVTGDSLVYHEDTKEFDITLSGKVVISGYTELTIGTGSESFVLGDTLATFLGNLKTWMDAHTHLIVGAMAGGPGLTSNAPLVTSPAVPDVTSAKIKGE